MAATRRLLARDGYDQVSIEAIAKEAGVSRPTIYRRWPSKAHLVFDAAFGQAPDGELLGNSGDFDADLHSFVRAVLSFWGEPVVEAATLGILAEQRRDSELHIRTQQALDERTRTAFRSLVEAGIAQGAVRSDVDVAMLYQLLIGSAFYAVQVESAERLDQFAERLCALLVQGIRSAPRQQKGIQ